MASISNSTDRFNGVVASKAIKVRCVVGLQNNVALLSGISNPYEGVNLLANDRVLLTGQADPIENGIWCVSDTAWARAADWDGSRDVELGSTVWAGQQTGFDILWQLTAPAGVVQPGSTAVTLTILFNPNAPSLANLSDVTTIGNDTLGNAIIISQTPTPRLTLRDSNSNFSTATGEIFFEDQTLTLVASVTVPGSSDLRLSTENGTLILSPGNPGSGNVVSFEGPLEIVEQNTALAPPVASGKLWVRDDVPNVLVFTDDAGGETVLGVGGGSGAVGSIQWTFNSPAGGDPGADTFRISPENLTLTSAFWFSDTDLGSLDVQNILSTIPAGGHIVMRKVDDNSQFRVYAILSIANNAGWYQFNVDYMFGNGDTTALTVGDEVTFEFFTGAYTEPGSEVLGQSDLLYWEGSTSRWEATQAGIRVNPNSPPSGGRLSLGGTSGFSTASPQIMSVSGAVSTCVHFIYGSSVNSGFYQRYDPGPNPDVMVFGARVASVNTDLLTFNQSLDLRIESGAKFLIGEKAAAGTDVTAFGQVWVRDDVPNVLMFTDDTGADFVLNGPAGNLPTGTLSGNQKDILYWNGSGWAASGIGLRVNQSSPPIGGRLRMSGGSSVAVTNAQLYIDVGNSVSTLWYMENGSDGFYCQNDNQSSDFVRWGHTITGEAFRMGTSGSGPTFVMASATRFYIEEKTAASSAGAGSGQFWVRDDAPNTPMFTDDAGTDFVLNASGAGTVTSSGSPLANQIAVFTAATDIDSNAGFTYDGTKVILTATVGAGLEVHGPSSQIRVYDTVSTGDSADYMSMDVQDNVMFLGGTDVSGAGFKALINMDVVTGVVRVGNTFAGSEIILNQHTRLEDNFELRFGDLAGGDVTLDWNGSNFTTVGPAASVWLISGFDQVRIDGPLGMNEQAAPDGNVAGVGQYWVRSSSPCRPEFRDDTDVNQLLDPSISEIVSVVASRTLVIGDKGKTIGFTGSTAAQTMTIPANGSVGYQIGTLLGFDNDGSVSISIAITTDTLIFADDGTTGTRTLAAGGSAVAQKIGATRWKISGAQLT